MGFTLRFILGLFLVLAICSRSKSASTWRRMKLLSQEPSTLEPIGKNSELNTSSNHGEKGEQKPKTDETNKIVSEIGSKEDNEPSLDEHKLDKPLSVTENNDLSKDSLESTKTAYPKAEDLTINIEKYISPEFHDKNNIYKLPTSPDIEKYIDVGHDAHLKTTSNLDSTSSYDFVKKFQTIENDIKKTLKYIDEFPKSTHQYEETTGHGSQDPLTLIKYQNTSFIGNNGNKVQKDEQLEAGKKLDYGSSYSHTVFDEQKHISSSETFVDNKPKTNETDDLKNKIFRAKTTVDPEVLHEKLNQTERHSALLSNKIEHDSTNENRRQKWSFHYTPTTAPLTTTTGQKEEILFVPYTKENHPINISKRGSTKFSDTITTQKPVERKHTKLLDEAAVENQIYPVQVPAPNKISKEDTIDSSATTLATTTLNNTQTAIQNVTSLPTVNITNENPTTERGTTETEDITSNTVLDTTKPSEAKSLQQTLVSNENNLTFNASTLAPVNNDEVSSSVAAGKGNENHLTFNATTLAPRNNDEVSSFVATGKGNENHLTFNVSTLAPENNYVVSNTVAPGKGNEENSTVNSLFITPENQHPTENSSMVTNIEKSSVSLNNSYSTPLKGSDENSTSSSISGVETTTMKGSSMSLAPEKNDEENSTISSTTGIETTTLEGLSTTTDNVSDQTTSTVIANEAVTNNLTFSSTATSKDSEVTQTPTNIQTDTETTTVFDPTLRTSSSLQLSTSFTIQPEQNVSIKIGADAKSTASLKIEDRTTSSRDLKNFTILPKHSSTSIPDTETPIGTTTIDYNDNIIKQGDTITSTTEHIRKDVPTNAVSTHMPHVEKKVFSSYSTSEPSSNEDTTGSGYTGSEEQEEGISGGKIAAIVISCIGALCFIILAILLFVMRKRHKRFNYGQRCTPVSLDAYSVDNVSTYNSVRRKGMMRASKRSYGNPAFEEASVTHLLNFPELIKFGSNIEGIASEYDDIPQISVQMNELPEGCDTKNRYANVIPLPESRVFLSSTDECPNSDYINANFVTGPKSTKNYYIACQAPMQNTVDDFWRMIWEQQSRVVLMLTHLFENGAEKCFDYVPPSEVLDCNRLFGDFQITLKKREVKEKYVISNLQLKNMISNTWREVTHLWYLGWPERGVPTEESSLVAFLIEARSYAKAAPAENGKLKEPTPQGTNGALQPEQNPIVVHCSPGTGRTGAVVACDIAIREFELTRQVDIPKTVYQIRRNRAGAVQTKEQYAFIYRVITWYANKLTGGVLDST